MDTRILITYASRAGSTIEIAQEIGRVLSQAGAKVDVLPVKAVRSVEDYQAVVVGSAIRIGQWLPEAVKFVTANRAALAGKRVAYFAVHGMNLGDDEASRAARQAYLEPVRKVLAPQMEACFGGVNDWNKVGFFDGLLGKMVKAPVGDFRDWTVIREWAADIAPLADAAQAGIGHS